MILILFFRSQLSLLLLLRRRRLSMICCIESFSLPQSVSQLIRVLLPSISATADAAIVPFVGKSKLINSPEGATRAFGNKVSSRSKQARYLKWINLKKALILLHSMKLGKALIKIVVDGSQMQLISRFIFLSASLSCNSSGKLHTKLIILSLPALFREKLGCRTK